MNGSLQLIGFLLAVVGGICTLIATFLPEWKRNDPQEPDSELAGGPRTLHFGLWIRCASYPNEQWQCTMNNGDYKNMSGLTQGFSVARWTSVVANLFGGAAFLMYFIGLASSICMESNPRIKRRIALICSVCWVMCGIMTGVAVSIYSHGVLTDNSSKYFWTPKYVFGSAIFIGWTAMVLCIVGGLIMGCCSFFDKSSITKSESASRASKRQVGRLSRIITQLFKRGKAEVLLRKNRDDAECV